MGKRGKGRPKTPQWKKLAASVAAAVTVGAGGVGIYKNLPYFIGERVRYVIDGDTVVLENSQSIKLYGVDAPEPENCYGAEATAYLKKLLTGKRVFLREPVTDQYRRIVALVYLDRKLVNEMVIRDGYGFFTRAAESATQVMQEANKYAREKAIGIYGPECYQKDPPNPKCAIKGNLDRDKKVWTYLTPGCSYYDVSIVEKFKGERWFCSEAEAIKAGYTKHGYCK